MILKDKISQFMQLKGLTTYAFEQKCGLPIGTIARCTDGMNTKSLAKIMTVFPELNVRWLLLDEGESVIEGTSNKDSITSIEIMYNELKEEYQRNAKQLEDRDAELSEMREKQKKADEERQNLVDLMAYQLRLLEKMEGKK